VQFEFLVLLLHAFDSSAVFKEKEKKARHITLSFRFSIHRVIFMIVFLSSRPTLSIQQHPPSAAISIQRPAQPRDAATRITLPSHPAIGAQKQQLHTMAQVGCKGETLLPLSGIV